MKEKGKNEKRRGRIQRRKEEEKGEARRDNATTGKDAEEEAKTEIQNSQKI